MGAPPVATAVLIYDAECAMCRASALWLMRLALSGGALEILPCRSEPRRARFPWIADEACMAAMQLVLPDGRVLTGADAVPELLRRIRRLRWLAALHARRGGYAHEGVRHHRSHATAEDRRRGRRRRSSRHWGLGLRPGQPRGAPRSGGAGGRGAGPAAEA